MVSTLDSESSDPSSSLGGTYRVFFRCVSFICMYVGMHDIYICIEWQCFNVLLRWQHFNEAKQYICALRRLHQQMTVVAGR